MKTGKASRKVGRPTKYSESIAKEICRAIARTRDGMEKILETREDFPCRATFYEWLLDHDAFMDMYIRAKKIQSLSQSDEIIDIADFSALDTKVDSRGNEVIDKEWVLRSKLRVEVRQWQVERLWPKIYGNKVSNEHTGKDGKPIEHEVQASVSVYLPDNGRSKN